MKRRRKRRVKTWSAVSSRVLCKTPHITVQRDQVLHPDSRVRPYIVVKRHDFAVIVPRFPNGDLLMVRQYRYPIQRHTWEFPMGIVRGVSMAKAARTELKEETGYTARRWRFLGKYDVAAGVMSQRAHIYLAEGLVPGEPCPEDGEFVTVRRIPRATYKRWLRSRRIKDAPSMMAWMFLTN